jgi:hypothetical protein
MFISFKEFLENLKTMKFTVAVGMTKLGEVYNINGDQLLYRDIPQSKYGQLLRQYHGYLNKFFN